MEKHMLQASYWLGLASSLIAVVWKVLEALRAAPEGFRSVTYMSFYKGGLLFLLIAIATVGFAWLKNQKA